MATLRCLTAVGVAAAVVAVGAPLVEADTPPEGVVDRAWASATVNGPPTAVLPAKTTVLWAHFHFASVPDPAYKRFTVEWVGPHRSVIRAGAAVAPDDPQTVRAGFVIDRHFRGKTYIFARGTWQAILRDGPTFGAQFLVSRVSFRLA